MSTFDPEYADDGTPIARPHADPATADKWTQPHLPDTDPTPAALAPINLDEERATAQLFGVPAANLDANDRPHFLRNVDGLEVCGQDGQAWPCTEYRKLLDDDQRTNNQAGLVPADGMVRVGDVAAAIGLTPAELSQRMGFPPGGAAAHDD